MSPKSRHRQRAEEGVENPDTSSRGSSPTRSGSATSSTQPSQGGGREPADTRVVRHLGRDLYLEKSPSLVYMDTSGDHPDQRDYGRHPDDDRHRRPDPGPRNSPSPMRNKKFLPPPSSSESAANYNSYIDKPSNDDSQVFRHPNQPVSRPASNTSVANESPHPPPHDSSSPSGLVIAEDADKTDDLPPPPRHSSGHSLPPQASAFKTSSVERIAQLGGRLPSDHLEQDRRMRTVERASLMSSAGPSRAPPPLPPEDMDLSSSYDSSLPPPTSIPSRQRFSSTYYSSSSNQQQPPQHQHPQHQQQQQQYSSGGSNSRSSSNKPSASPGYRSSSRQSYYNNPHDAR